MSMHPADFVRGHRHALRAPLAVACGALALLVIAPAAQAHDASVTPVKVDGNPKCADYGLTTIAKFDPVNSGTKNGVTLKKHDTYYVKWTSTVAVDRVIVKGGDNANIYKYASDTYGDDWLHAPQNGSKPFGLSHVEFCGSKKPEKPGIEIVKDGPSTRYVGEQATFIYKVKNAGNVKLSEPVVSDDKCAPVTKVTQEGSFDPGDVWEYTCTTTITDAMGDELVNVGKACAEHDGGKVCDDDDHKTKIPKPAILLDKTGAATAVAGSTFTYSFKATNTGDVPLANVELTDDRCESTLTRVAPNLDDPSFEPGDEWFYTCTVIAPAGPVQVDNVAEVCGEYAPPNSDPKTVCDDDPHTFTVPPPVTPPNTPPATPPGNTPPASVPNQVPGASAGGGVLPVRVASGRAALRGPSGCSRKAFKARVRGRSIASVTFFVDGKKVKKVRGKRSVYSIKVRPGRYGFGRHKVVARVRFTRASGTKARKLPLTFRRCAQDAVSPRFTG